MKRPIPSASDASVPSGVSTYLVTTTPASAQQCKNHSIWHAATEYSNMSSGLYKLPSPRNAGADEHARGVLPLSLHLDRNQHGCIVALAYCVQN